MITPFEDLSPPLRLAVAYAPKRVRDAFGLLLMFDQRLADIVGRASEPMIGQLKLAWWRDALSSTPEARPKGEPLLAALFEQEKPELVVAARRLVDAWEMMLSGEIWSEDTIDVFSEQRAIAVFGGYGELVDRNDIPLAAGREWAKRDLLEKFGKAEAGSVVADEALPRQRILRPLTLLIMLSRGVSGPRYLWHGLTGR